MGLTSGETGKRFVVRNISYGKKMKKKLLDMGLTPGTECSIITKQAKGPMIIDVRGTRMIIGRGIAEKIMVEAC